MCKRSTFIHSANCCFSSESTVWLRWKTRLHCPFLRNIISLRVRERADSKQIGNDPLAREEGRKKVFPSLSARSGYCTYCSFLQPTCPKPVLPTPTEIGVGKDKSLESCVKGRESDRHWGMTRHLLQTPSNGGVTLPDIHFKASEREGPHIKDTSAYNNPSDGRG